MQLNAAAEQTSFELQQKRGWPLGSMMLKVIRASYEYLAKVKCSTIVTASVLRVIVFAEQPRVNSMCIESRERGY